MKTSEPNPEEILKKHCKNERDHWIGLKKEGALKAMREYAEAYHKARLRRELINYSVWKRKKFLAESKFTENVVDEYLKGKR